ncbi:methionine--tRNA ligase subunit beta, partial [Salinispira pacifica]
NENPASARALIHDLVYLVRDLAVLTAPYIPGTADRIAGFLGRPSMDWRVLGTHGEKEQESIGRIERPEILFKQLENDQIEGLRARFAGTQADRRAEEAQKAERERAELPARFSEKVELRVARITAIEKHPKADKLYVESIDLGTEQRQIVSGLVPHYAEEELLGHNIILVANLKPARLRGVESQGMLLAASDDSAVDVIFADSAEPGARVTLSGVPAGAEHLPEIDIDTFFSMPIHAVSGRVMVGEAPLEVSGKPLRTQKVPDGKVG